MGRPQHLRRSDPVTASLPRSRPGRPGPDQARCGPCSSTEEVRTTPSRQRRGRGGPRAVSLRERCLSMPTLTGHHIRPRLPDRLARAGSAARNVRPLPRLVRGRPPMTTLRHWQRPSTRVCVRRSSRIQSHHHGRGCRKARRRLPITDGLQKDFGEQRVIDHSAGRVGHHRHRDRPGHPGYRPVCEIQFDGFVYRARPDRVAGPPRCIPLGGRVRVRWSSDPVRRGIGAVEHPPESPRRTSPHTAGLKVVACSNPPTPTR